MNKLTKFPTGRMMLHVIAVCSCVAHCHCPHSRFFVAAVMRYIKGQG